MNLDKDVIEKVLTQKANTELEKIRKDFVTKGDKLIQGLTEELGGWHNRDGWNNTLGDLFDTILINRFKSKDEWMEGRKKILLEKIIESAQNLNRLNEYYNEHYPQETE